MNIYSITELFIQITALVKAGDGNALRRNVMEPAPYMEKGITSLLTRRNSFLMGTAAMFSLRITVGIVCLAVLGFRLRRSHVERLKALAPQLSSST